jgi:hypothetical protein
MEPLLRDRSVCATETSDRMDVSVSTEQTNKPAWTAGEFKSTAEWLAMGRVGEMVFRHSVRLGVETDPSTTAQRE